MREANNPYLTGTGTTPPLLAGRATVKEEIETALVRIKRKPDRHGLRGHLKMALQLAVGKVNMYERGRVERVSPPIMLLGPRGVGKTALLEWSKQQAERHGVRSAVLSEELLGGPIDLLGVAILGDKGYAKAAKERAAWLDLGHTGAVGKDLQNTYLARFMSIRSILNRQLKKGGLLLILDEAHAVAPELLNKFCIATQEFVQDRRPLALVIAGTPGLEGHLLDLNVNFLEGSEIMTLRQLAKEEAREALSVPAADTGVPMEADALEVLVEWTDCYPFFIQVAGWHAWDVAKGRGATKITIEDAKLALREAEQSRRKFCTESYGELAGSDLTGYAMQVIELIERKPDKKIEYTELVHGIENANEGMKHKRALEIYESLMNHGFINKTCLLYEAGIPSLFDYVKEQETSKPHTKKLEPERVYG